jgi:hypothetical protein
MARLDLRGGDNRFNLIAWRYSSNGLPGALA